MNRAMRRAAAQGRVFKEKVIPFSKFIDEAMVFQDIDKMIEKLENGFMDFEDGKPVMMSGDGLSDVVACLNSWISVWDRYKQKFHLIHNQSALVRVCNCLHKGIRVSQSQVAAAKAVIAEQKRLFNTFPRDQVRDTAKVEQTAQYLKVVK